MRPLVTIFLRACLYRSNARSGWMAGGGSGSREEMGEQALGNG